MRRLPSPVANVLLLASSAVLVLAGLEGAIRLARHFEPGGKEQRTRRLYTQPDPLLGWRKTPGERVRYERREYRTEVRINSKGLRDLEREYQARPGAFRVLALGDSFVEAFMVPLEQTVTQQLEAALAGSACPVEVINGGTTGYSTDQEYLFYDTEGFKYGPQVVLLFFYYNDVLYNDSGINLGLPKPRLLPDGESLRVANYPVPPRPAAPPAAPRVPARGSAALEWIGERLEGSAPHLYNALSRLGLWAPIRRVSAAAELGVFQRRPGREIELAWDMTHRIVRALNRSVGLHGGRLLIAYVPSHMEVHDPSWDLSKLRYGWGERAWSRAEVARRLGEFADRERIPWIDLTPALRQANGWWRPAYFVQDHHWNGRGQRVAALAIRQTLRRLGWAPSCSY